MGLKETIFALIWSLKKEKYLKGLRSFSNMVIKKGRRFAFLFATDSKLIN